MSDSNGSENGKENNEPLIVIASNRGPFSFTHTDEGEFVSKRGAGGLVTALSGVASSYDILWVSAALGKDDDAWAKAHPNGTNVEDIRLKMVRVNRDAYKKYYNRIANPLLWFIQHQLWEIPRKPSITDATWAAWRDGYLKINKQFADAVADGIPKNTKRPVIIMPQDYHLYVMPKYLRDRLGQNVQIQSFVHIPWPGPDAWRILPEEMRNTLLSGMLAADRVGFQTKKDAFNFVQTARFYLEGAHSHGSRDSIHYKGRKVGAYAYPISVDAEKVKALTEEAQTRLLKDQMRAIVGDRKLILRTDRVEPSKNILRGLEAYRTLLAKHPEHQGKVQMLALLVPSRMEVTEYKNYLRDIMAKAGMINADFADEFWEPVRIIVGNNYHRALAAMSMYDVLLVNPIVDGMNLVAKEGVLVNDRNGVLVLSEAAGAHYELGDSALTVSPFDIFSTAEAIHKALTMPASERSERAERARKIVERNDVKNWFRAQIEDSLRADNTQLKKASTSAMPPVSKSELSRTESGMSSDSTPKPSE